MKYRFLLFILSVVFLSSAATAQTQLIITIAGTGATGFDGDGNSAAGAVLSGPTGVAVDGVGNVYIQDMYNNRVRKINGAGIISTIAGNGIQGYTGDGSIGSNAEVMPSGIAVDGQGSLFIADESHSVIRKVNIYGIISTYAGIGTFGHTGDGGAATSARIATPYGLATDVAGNLYIADASKHVVRKVSKTGIISLVAGTDTPGYNGDGASAILAALDSPYSVAVDRKNNVYITDLMNNVIRKVDAAGIITTYAGIRGNYNYTGDGGPASAATLSFPRGLAVDTIGNLYIADAENNVIRMVDTFGMISTVVGNGTLGYAGDGGYALGSNLHNPYGVAVDRYGSIYVADANNQRIRKTYNPLLGVDNLPNGSNLVLYPNPCSAVVTVSGLKRADKICVYDVAGRAVSNLLEVRNDGTQNVDVKNLTSGLYIMQVTDATGNKKDQIKLVKE